MSAQDMKYLAAGHVPDDRRLVGAGPDHAARPVLVEPDAVRPLLVADQRALELTRGDVPEPDRVVEARRGERGLSGLIAASHTSAVWPMKARGSSRDDSFKYRHSQARRSGEHSAKTRSTRSYRLDDRSNRPARSAERVRLLLALQVFTRGRQRRSLAFEGLLRLPLLLGQAFVGPAASSSLSHRSRLSASTAARCSRVMATLVLASTTIKRTVEAALKIISAAVSGRAGRA